MPKLNKNYYYSRTGERKVNCYVVNIPKEVLQKSCIKEEDNIRIYEKDGKVIIEKEKNVGR